MQSILLLYLDPGTGSLLLYAILGVCTTILFLIKKVFYKIREIILGRKSSMELNSKYDIVLHSEGGRYFSTFSSIIEEFIKNRRKIYYITPDKNDPAFDIKSEYLEVINPGNEITTISFMNNITANIVISTTPHLDIYMWKKSKKVKKYIHIFHAPTSVDLYEKYALSFYDIIISSVKKTEETQKYLDSLRNLPQKEYYLAGCTYLDAMVQKKEFYDRTNDKRTVLYAPSWGTRSSIYTYGIEIIEELLKSGFCVLFRPHPQSYISDKQKIESITSIFESNSNFLFDSNKDGLQSMINSDLMISDFSGVIFDYYYLFNKPILLASVNVNTNGYEVEDLPVDMQFDIPATKEITIELSEENIKNISKIVETQIENNTYGKGKKYIQNLGHAGTTIYEIIMKIEEKIK